MKKTMIFMTALMAGVTLAGTTVPAQAATTDSRAGMQVIVADGQTLSDCLKQWKAQQSGGCTIITFPCVPGVGQMPEDWPESKPEDQPESKPEEQPESKPEEQPENQPENKPEDQPENKPEDQPDSDNSEETSYHAYILRVVELVNEERAKAGLAPLTLQKNITQAAQVRAEECERSFSHTRPDGKNFSSALTEAGVSYRGSGENIAWGQRTPEQVMEGWMNSAGHRANILNEKYTSIGVGYYQNASGVNYWSQLFTF